MDRIEELFNSGNSVRKIAKELGVSTYQVSKFLKNKGYTLLSNRQKSELFKETVDWEQAEKDYEEGLSMQKVAKKHGVTYDVVREHFLKRGVTIRDARECQRSRTIYHHKNIFEPLTEQGAYLLGWILSDGTIGSKLKTVKIMVGKEDRTHADYLRQLITDSPIKEEKKSVGFSVTSAEIYESLQRLGVQPRKSFRDYDINWDLISERYYPYLLLGLFEGDGSISKIAGDLSFLLPSKLYGSIKERIFKPLGVTDYKVKDVPGNKYGLKLIRFLGREYYAVGLYMYANTPAVVPLERKFLCFVSHAERVVNGNGRYSPFKDLASLTLRVLKV